jgi:hypothetical protein
MTHLYLWQLTKHVYGVFVLRQQEPVVGESQRHAESAIYTQFRVYSWFC